MIIYKNKTRLRRKHQLRHSLSQYAVTKAINVRPRARGRVGGRVERLVGHKTQAARADCPRCQFNFINLCF